ncbi:MAG TPA: preprotein translocase subunit SecA [Chloroflexota bacterium]|nr:preprotein translocase subunit SecA [Chloroflexota bacterium]
MLGWLTKVIGESSEREIRKIQPIVREINALEGRMQALSDEELRGLTTRFRERLADGESLDDLLPEAYAAVREAARRTIGLRHFDVQLIGGIVLHQRKIGELKTGEGKTLMATLPLYLNALPGKGAHLVTVNDYLAKRDAQWMGPVYHALGLSVGVIQHEMAFLYDPSYEGDDPRLRHLRPVPRREAYLADITYGTNNEFGFDYLRDNMVVDLRQCVQRPLHFAVIDEIDNILIDEARTPLIISAQAEQATDRYYLFARLVPRLNPGTDFKIDEKVRAVMLTEEGIHKLERWLNLDNLYDPENYELTHYLEQALKAHFIFKRDRDYVLVKDGRVLEPGETDRDAEVVIVDEFTGRLMFGRRFSEGLHQAIEAKENVRIQQESQTLATITLQNYFRMYPKLAGMTGTAWTEREEFRTIYGLDVVVVPTHRPMIRQDFPDVVYKTEEAKFRAVVNEIEEMHRAGRPVLVGTISIEKSEYLSNLLKKRNIPHQVLNAKYHEREAAIIAQAGRPGAVTIATNMAGRGVDILLGGNPAGLVNEILEKKGIDPLTAEPDQIAAARAEAERLCARDQARVRELGGLHIIGTERHEARRIDNQLRGRAGRQGDPGSSRFYVSLEDDLMRRFGGPNIASLMDRLGLEDDVPIEHGLVSKAIENAQTKVEGHNFDLRKHVVEYDNVLNKHREIIYGERRKILGKEDLSENIRDMIHQELNSLVDAYTSAPHMEDWDLEGLAMALRGILPPSPAYAPPALHGLAREEIRSTILNLADEAYQAKEQEIGPEIMRQVERLLMLQVIDRHWVEHLTAIEDLRQGIGLRAYGQRDPLVEYKAEAYRMFQSLLAAIRHDVVHSIYHVSLQREQQRPAQRRFQTNRQESEEPREPVRVGRKIGRNDPCPCGSGKKYKKCHGR